jgi:hypothetical protein
MRETREKAIERHRERARERHRARASERETERERERTRETQGLAVTPFPRDISKQHDYGPGFEV